MFQVVFPFGDDLVIDSALESLGSADGRDDEVREILFDEGVQLFKLRKLSLDLPLEGKSLDDIEALVLGEEEALLDYLVFQDEDLEILAVHVFDLLTLATLDFDIRVLQLLPFRGRLAGVRVRAQSRVIFLFRLDLLVWLFLRLLYGLLAIEL